MFWLSVEAEMDMHDRTTYHELLDCNVTLAF